MKIKTQPYNFLANAARLHLEYKLTGVLHISEVPSFEDAVLLSKVVLGLNLVKQPDGNIFTDVKPTKSKENRSDAGSAQPIAPHTDGLSNPIPVKALGLYCENKTKGFNDPTFFASVADVFTRVDSELLDWAISEPLIWEHIDSKNGESITAPVFDLNGESGFRFSANFLRYNTSSPTVKQIETGWSMGNACHKCEAAELCKPERWKLADGVTELCETEEIQKSVVIEKNSLLILDNQRYLHFRGTVSDPNRHLKRFWMA